MPMVACFAPLKRYIWKNVSTQSCCSANKVGEGGGKEGSGKKGRETRYVNRCRWGGVEWINDE